MKTNLEGRYTSTYGFVGNNGLEKQAEITFGKDWEAEFDVEQIQELCDNIEKGRYHVYCIETRDDEDIVVRESDNWEDFIRFKMKLNWFNDFVDYVQEYDDNVYNLACKWADKMEADGEQ